MYIGGCSACIGVGIISPWWWGATSSSICFSPDSRSQSGALAAGYLSRERGADGSSWQKLTLGNCDGASAGEHRQLPVNPALLAEIDWSATLTYWSGFVPILRVECWPTVGGNFVFYSSQFTRPKEEVESLGGFKYYASSLAGSNLHWPDPLGWSGLNVRWMAVWIAKVGASPRLTSN